MTEPTLTSLPSGPCPTWCDRVHPDDGWLTPHRTEYGTPVILSSDVRFTVDLVQYGTGTVEIEVNHHVGEVVDKIAITTEHSAALYHRLGEALNVTGALSDEIRTRLEIAAEIRSIDVRGPIAMQEECARIAEGRSPFIDTPEDTQ